MDVVDVAVTVGADVVVVITPVEVVRSLSKPDMTVKVLYVNVGDKVGKSDNVDIVVDVPLENDELVVLKQEAANEVALISQSRLADVIHIELAK